MRLPWHGSGAATDGSKQQWVGRRWPHLAIIWWFERYSQKQFYIDWYYFGFPKCKLYIDWYCFFAQKCKSLYRLILFFAQKCKFSYRLILFWLPGVPILYRLILFLSSKLQFLYRLILFRIRMFIGPRGFWRGKPPKIFEINVICDREPPHKGWA